MGRKIGVIVFCCLFSLLSVGTLWAQDNSITGLWKTIDDETGDEKSIVKLYEEDGKYFGRIVKLFRKAGEEQNPVCDECPADDPRKDQPLIGMEIIKNLEKSGDVYKGGTILDPGKGKIYKCKLWLEEGKLQVRGYVAFFFRTQTWLPVE